MKTKQKIQQGICPKCGSENLNYETCINDGDTLYYPYICEGCKFRGQEHYNIDFDSHWDANTHEEIT